MKHSIHRLHIGACAAAALGIAYASVRRRRSSWRATDAEATRTLAGDDIVPTPIDSLTHAITIRRPRADVWPWLVQMGATRGGWYSYDFIDNGRQRSLDRIDPELQHIEVGTIMPALPGVTDGFTVLRIDPERSLVIGWAPAADAPPITTWAFVLEEPEPGRTRLIVRARGSAAYEPPFGLPRWTIRMLIPLGHAVMQRQQLLGIRARAERAQH